LVSAAAALAIEDGVIREARIAVGGVGTRPWRLRACEAALAGRKPDRQAFVEAAQLATEGARPLHHNAFKVTLLPRTIVRALEMAGEVA
jgi:xanthine dehydrogenase YagS FAD-binding subunit